MRILDVLTSPWAIQPEKLQEITDIYSRHLKGEKIDIKAIEAKAGMPFENSPQGYDIANGVAIIPVHGVIAKKMNLFHQISGGASTELIGRDIQDALDDESVNSIILDIDSPGGTVDGTQDLANIVYKARESKPIVALANGLMASAAYWIGSAANAVYIANGTTITGSIGVVSTHVDYSEQLKSEGVKVTEIYAGKYKRINSEYSPLSKEGRSEMQGQVDYLYSVFVNAVAKNRGVDADAVLDDMADGRLFIGEQAINAGLVDGVSTMEALITQLSSNHASLTSAEATALVTELENSLKENNMEITKKVILEDHADIADSIFADGVASVNVEAIKAAAASAEQDRIKDVMEQGRGLGHDALIETLAFDGKTTGPQAAVEILKAEKAAITSIGQAIKADGEELLVSPSVEIKDTDSNLPVEKRCQIAWDKSSDLRTEFMDDFDSYVEFEKANAAGQVKVLKGGN